MGHYIKRKDYITLEGVKEVEEDLERFKGRCWGEDDQNPLCGNYQRVNKIL